MRGCASTRDVGLLVYESFRIWFHAETELGSVPENAVAPDGTVVGSHSAELANNYVDAQPDQPFFNVYGGLRARELRLKLQSLLDLVDPPPAWKYFAGASLPIMFEGDSLIGVFDDGHRESADFIATDAMRAKLVDPTYRWVSPAEASPFVGGRGAPYAIALSIDGTAVLSAPRLLHGVLDDGVGCDFNSDVCNPSAPRTAAASSARSTSPSARTNFVPVYSRAQGRVFVVGGRDASTGGLVDEVWTYRVQDGHWDRLAPRGWLGDVVDATFSWRDGRLWILSYDPADPQQRKLRLLALEPTTGAGQLVTTVTRGPIAKYEVLGLFLDMDGNVGIYASSERAQKHRLAVLTARAGGYDVKMTLRRDRHLSAPPMVDLRGVALYFEPDRPPTDHSADPADDSARGDRVVAASRLRELPWRTATLASLEDLLK